MTSNDILRGWCTTVAAAGDASLAGVLSASASTASVSKERSEKSKPSQALIR
jgi:hypothetical protein